MVARGWWAAGNEWLCKKANDHFSNWCKSTPEGKRWSRSAKKKSPYHCGYSQPHWMNEARQALGENNEEMFKYIKIAQLVKDV